MDIKRESGTLLRREGEAWGFAFGAECAALACAHPNGSGQNHARYWVSFGQLHGCPEFGRPEFESSQLQIEPFEFADYRWVSLSNEPGTRDDFVCRANPAFRRRAEATAQMRVCQSGGRVADRGACANTYRYE